MPPKKKQKTDPCAETAEKPVPAGKLQEQIVLAINTIKNRCADVDQMPPVGQGNLAPFDEASYTDEYATKGAALHYQAAVNIWWISPFLSVLGHVPISVARVQEFAAQLKPEPFVDPIYVVATKKLVYGNILRVSPEEIHLALLLRVADRINNEAPDEELNQWVQVMRSVPCIFCRLDTEDEQFGMANSIRVKAASFARAVTLSARQQIYNIAGFRQRKDQALPGDQRFSAADIAKFWEEHVLSGAATEPMTFKTVDACLSIHEKVLSLPVCDTLIQDAEESRGPDSAWTRAGKS
jgi:hypothetical protein